MISQPMMMMGQSRFRECAREKGETRCSKFYKLLVGVHEQVSIIVLESF